MCSSLVDSFVSSSVEGSSNWFHGQFVLPCFKLDFIAMPWFWLVFYLTTTGGFISCEDL